MPEVGWLALGSLGTLFFLALWFRADVLTRVGLDGELRVSAKNPRSPRALPPKALEDFFAQAQELEKKP